MPMPLSPPPSACTENKDFSSKRALTGRLRNIADVLAAIYLQIPCVIELLDNNKLVKYTHMLAETSETHHLLYCKSANQYSNPNPLLW